MRIGIIGLPQVGKKTLFELLTGQAPTEKELVSNRPIRGTAWIRDSRFDDLVSIYRPKKEVRPRLEIDILPKLEKETINKGEIFIEINELNAICHVIRAFKDDSIYHIEGSVDPKRDIDFVNSELLLHDMIFIEKRFEKLQKSIKGAEEGALKEKEVLAKLKAYLDKTLPLRLLDLSADDEKVVSGYPLVTRKAMLIVLNIGEEDLKDSSLLEQVRNDLKSLKVGVIQFCAKAELDIGKLESEDERREFLETLQIKERALDSFTRLCVNSLNLISFFTVKSDEVRQWLIKAGSTAIDAAGLIHSDIARGFIRSEVIKYNDLIELGSDEKVKQAGKMHLKGKDYVVEDGDIITIRFNV